MVSIKKEKMQLVQRINDNKYVVFIGTIGTFVTIIEWLRQLYNADYEMDSEMIIDGIVAFMTTGLLLVMIKVLREFYKKMLVSDAMAQVRSKKAFENSIESIEFSKSEVHERYIIHLQKERSALFEQLQHNNSSLNSKQIEKLIEDYYKSMMPG
jgi:hypothetical protein